MAKPKRSGWRHGTLASTREVVDQSIRRMKKIGRVTLVTGTWGIERQALETLEQNQLATRDVPVEPGTERAWVCDRDDEACAMAAVILMKNSVDDVANETSAAARILRVDVDDVEHFIEGFDAAGGEDVTDEITTVQRLRRVLKAPRTYFELGVATAVRHGLVKRATLVENVRAYEEEDWDSRW
jgi:hypothetical protein